MTKASDNAFPSILITEGTEPSAPAAGKQRLYIDSTSHKLKRTDSSGTDVDIEAGSIGAWTSFTPTWTSTGTAPALGNGSLTGRYKAIDSKTYCIAIRLTWGSTTTGGTGDWRFALPAGVTATASMGSQLLAGYIEDSGTDNKLVVGVVFGSATTVGGLIPEGGNTVSATTPMTWANGDKIGLSGTIEVA